jgi:hypothetical protein
MLNHSRLTKTGLFAPPLISGIEIGAHKSGEDRGERRSRFGCYTGLTFHRQGTGMSTVKRFFRQQITRVGRTLNDNDLAPEREPVYQAIVDRDLHTLGIENRYYPLSGAANYSLLYLLLRSAQEFDIKRLVELGAGQTSLLIESLSQRGLLRGSRLTIEHDPSWAERIGQLITHEIMTVPLTSRNDAPRAYRGYDLESIADPENIDFLLIDGPPAFQSEQTFARFGVLALLKFLDPAGYVIIVDDAERTGERLLVTRIEQELAARGDNIKKAEIRATKKQVVLASGRFEAAAYF